MRVLGALGVTLALMVAIVVVGGVTDVPWFGLLVVLGTAIWAAVDSSQLELHKYRGGDHPIFWLLAIGCLWIIFFPLYLVTRSRRIAGELKLKKKYRTEEATALGAG